VASLGKRGCAFWAGLRQPCGAFMSWVSDAEIGLGSGSDLLCGFVNPARDGELMIEQVIAGDESDSGCEQCFSTSHTVFFDEFLPCFAHQVELDAEC